MAAFTPLTFMKTTTLILWLGCAAALLSPSRAEEIRPLPPEPEARREAYRAPADFEAALLEEQASFEREMERHVKEATEKAVALEAEGRKGAADELRAQIKKRVQAAVQEHRRAVREKLQAKVREQQQLQKERRELQLRQRAERQRAQAERRHHVPPEREAADHADDDTRPRELNRKLNHVQQAIRHLREAGLPEAAANLEKVAERLRNALHDHDAHHAHHPRPENAPAGADRQADELRALRREVEELKKSFDELRKSSGCEPEKEAKDKEAKEAGEKHH